MKRDSDTQNTGASSSTAQQDFHEAVGSVAGRDAIDNSENNAQVSMGDGAIHITSDSATVIQIGKLLNSLTESTLQANFYAATGIRCSKPTRQTLEMLMAEHGFNYYELARAWVTHSIVDNPKTGELRMSSARWLELAFGYFGMAISAVMFTFFMVSLLSIDLTQRGPYTNLLAIFLTFGFLGAVAYFVRSHLHPQKVAKRVDRALSKQLCEGSD